MVPRGAADRVFINTSGIGLIPDGVDISGRNARPGDRIILSGTMVDHGIAIMAGREGITFDTSVKSDTAPLNHMVEKMLAGSPDIHVLRDPTRGGVGTTLNEIAVSSVVGMIIHEERIPLRGEVAAMCELLGFDPLYLVNEGKLLAIVGPDHAGKLLEVMTEEIYGRDASIIGEVISGNAGMVS